MSEKIPTPQSEEVDLGKLFQVIGNGFKKMFSSIGDLFKAIFHYGVLALLFFRKHFIKLVGGAVLGGILGYVLSMGNPVEYKSDLIMETNFGSGQLLYSQQSYLNSLISRSDTDKLAKLFSISKDEANTLTRFSVEPLEKEHNLLNEYDYYMQHTDTIYTRKFTVQDFERRIKNSDFRQQKISAYATDQTIFTKLNKGLSKLIVNDYLNKRLKTTTDEYNKRRDYLERSLIKMDSIQKRYDKVAMMSASSAKSNGTNISLSETSNNKDVDLIKESMNIIYKLKNIDIEQKRNGFITNTISEFKFGTIQNNIRSQKWFRFGFLGFGLALLAILGVKLNTYLNKYQK